MALGARAAQIVNLVVLQNLRTVVMGLALGVACAIPATRLLRGLLFQVGPHDPVTFALIGSALTVVAVIAAYLPARRGTSVDPRL